MKNIFINALISILIGTIVYFLIINNSEKIVVVDAIKLFNGFKMKIELEAKDEVKLKKLSARVDSLENMLKILQNSNVKIDENSALVYEYKSTKSTLQIEYENSNRNINEQVWKRLNLLIAEFGKEEKIRVIIGANGMGTVLYNNAQSDLTEKAIQYVNRKYENTN